MRITGHSVTYVVLAVLIFSVHGVADLRWKWVYLQCNLARSEEVTRVKGIMTAASAAGYNGVVLADSKFTQLAYLKSPAYRSGIGQIRKLADDLDIEIIPCIFDLARAGNLLKEDVSLVEAMPVREVLLRVSDGRATLADNMNLLENCRTGAEQDTIAGWDYVDGFGKTLQIDRDESSHGGASYRFVFEEGGKYRLKKKVKLKPYTQYRISAWIKTQGVPNPTAIRALVMPNGNSDVRLSLVDFEVESTQDWKQHSVVFNSQDYEQADFFIGAWGLRSGRFWIDRVEIRECLGINLVRREGCPVKVTDSTGEIEYQEGIDFDYWQFRQIGNRQWPGTYHLDHQDIPLIVKPGSRIRDGQQLKISYYAVPVIGSGQVGICLSHPRTYGVLKEHIRRVNQLLSPRTVFIGCDEMRVAGQCALCRSRDMTSGRILAEAIKQCKAIVRDEIPAAEIFLWGDMFDPYQNATEDYYFCRGGMEESWQGLDPEIRVVNWNYEKSEKSLMFFNQRGHRQIIAWYYDWPNWEPVLDRWFQAAQALDGPKVEGVMYCSWKGDFSQLKQFLDRAITQKEKW